MPRPIFILIVWLALVAEGRARADSSPTARHLLAGVHAFRDGKYDEALVELRLVQAAPDAPADLAFYLGPTLYKLGRHREALAVFLASPAARDALTDFYLGQTYYQLRLYRKARATFAGLRARGLGPVLGAAAERYVNAVDALYARAPGPTAVDAYLAEGQALLRAGDAVVAAAYLEEAREIETLAPTSARHDELVAALAASWNASGRSAQVISWLAGLAPPLAPPVAWELARAYVTRGDAGAARPILERLVAGGGPHANEAARLLATLPR
jgi:FimV-like protein